VFLPNVTRQTLRSEARFDLLHVCDCDPAIVRTADSNNLEMLISVAFAIL
jgi:hypothetical protein